MNKDCNKCGDALVVGSTTSEAMLKRYDYRCMACRRTLDKPYEQARERIRPPDLERKRLWKRKIKDMSKLTTLSEEQIRNSERLAGVTCTRCRSFTRWLHG